MSDGVLAAAELLAKGDGKWAAVAELYRDSYPSFPKIYELLVKVQPPQSGLFDEPGALAGYPQANEKREEQLRYALKGCATASAQQARAVIMSAENEHGFRRGWLWSHMGQAPLAVALGHLAALAQCSAQLPTGSSPDELAQSYQGAGWKVDQAASRALAAVQATEDVVAVSAALRAIYLPWLDECAKRLQGAVKACGSLGKTAAFVAGCRRPRRVHSVRRRSALRRGDAAQGAVGRAG